MEISTEAAFWAVAEKGNEMRKDLLVFVAFVSAVVFPSPGLAQTRKYLSTPKSPRVDIRTLLE